MTTAPKPCEHMNFVGQVNVYRLSGVEGGPITGFTTGIEVKCADCGLPFRFKGIPFGSHPAEPRLRVDGEELRAPMQFHFGGHDRSTPPEDIARHRELQPQAQLYVYAVAGHAFNRDVDPRHFHAESAALARQRTLAFLAEHSS